MLESPFNKAAGLMTGYFFKNCEIFKKTYFEKQLQTAAFVHSVSKLEKWDMENS